MKRKWFSERADTGASRDRQTSFSSPALVKLNAVFGHPRGTWDTFFLAVMDLKTYHASIQIRADEILSQSN